MKLLHTLLISCALAIPAAEAQAPRPAEQPQGPPTSLLDMRDAYQTRDRFQQLLRQYAPSLSEVFRLDPSLLTNQAFLTPYPNLAAFLNQHPEIGHNPSFFVGEMKFFRDSRLDTPESRSYEMFEKTMAGIAAMVGGLIAVSVMCWVLKTIIDHRRWLRVSRIQSEVHSKLLDRFTSNEDLLAYVQTPAGRRFLESAPISTESESRRFSAPISRILFSVQAGIVLALAGVGINIVSQWVRPLEIAQPLFVIGALAMALGVGFVLSAFVAYALSRRLGLLDQKPLASASDNAGVSPPHA